MNKKLVHFIGIGGIGVSALARYYLAKGWQVSGSDLTPSEIINDLQTEGAKIFIGHSAAHVSPDTQLVVYSAAIQSDNQEYKEAKNLNIPLFSYAEILGDLTKQYITIAVSGAHGKSTTTALLSLMLIKAGLDPTVIIGTKLREFKGANFRLGKSRYLVIEADEWDKSFLNYYPTVAVITNIDKEHLDTYKNLNGVIETFAKYFRNVNSVGALILNSEDENVKKALKIWRRSGHQNKKCLRFETPPGRAKRWSLKVPGEFNQLNAEAAWQAAKFLGVKRREAEEAVKNYKGSWRRMEQLKPPTFVVKGEELKGLFFSDYAHHPNEIKATILALKEKYPSKKLLVVFQPHQAERLTNLFDDFVSCFDETDELALLPTYEVAGRELKHKNKTIDDLRSAISDKQPVICLSNFSETFKLIRGQVVVFMGAGDIDKEVRRYFTSKLL